MSAHLVRVDDEHHIMVVQAETEDALGKISGGPGGAWVGEHLAPLMVRPPERYVGQALAASPVTAP